LLANKCNEFLEFPAIRGCKKTTKRSGYFLPGSKANGVGRRKSKNTKKKKRYCK